MYSWQKYLRGQNQPPAAGSNPISSNAHELYQQQARNADYRTFYSSSADPRTAYGTMPYNAASENDDKEQSSEQDTDFRVDTIPLPPEDEEEETQTPTDGQEQDASASQQSNSSETHEHQQQSNQQHAWNYRSQQAHAYPNPMRGMYPPQRHMANFSLQQQAYQYRFGMNRPPFPNYNQQYQQRGFYPQNYGMQMRPQQQQYQQPQAQFVQQQAQQQQQQQQQPRQRNPRNRGRKKEPAEKPLNPNLTPIGDSPSCDAVFAPPPNISIQEESVLPRQRSNRQRRGGGKQIEDEDIAIPPFNTDAKVGCLSLCAFSSKRMSLLLSKMRRFGNEKMMDGLASCAQRGKGQNYRYHFSFTSHVSCFHFLLMIC